MRGADRAKKPAPRAEVAQRGCALCVAGDNAEDLTVGLRDVLLVAEREEATLEPARQARAKTTSARLWPHRGHRGPQSGRRVEEARAAPRMRLFRLFRLISSQPHTATRIA